MPESTTATELRDMLEIQLSENGETYPFTEDENCNITGYGHQDKAAFADAINRFDTEANGPFPEDEQWTAGHIAHAWVVYDSRTEHFLTVVPEPDDDRRVENLLVPGPVTESTPGAFPVTTLWGVR